MVKTIRETDDSPEGQGQDPRYAGVLRAQDEPVRLPGGSGVYTEVLRRGEAKWDK